MCDPKAIAEASLGAQGLGAAASAFATYKKAKGEKYANEVQAQVAENNATLSRWRARDATERGQNEQMRHQMKVAQLKGTQRASLAARGLDLTEGSALDILADTDFMGAIDANTIADNAEKEAWAYRQEASNYGSNAQLLRERAKDTSPFGAAGGSLLTDAGLVAEKWYQYKYPRVPGYEPR